MSATVMNLPVTEPQTVQLTEDDQNDVESVKCECCGLTEECTAAYICNIKERYKGKWICGLCTEAVNYEVVRSQRLITTEEALNKHMMFRSKFAGGPPRNTVVDLVSVMRQILRKSVDGSARSMPSSPRKKGFNRVLMRSESCIPALTLEEDDDMATMIMEGRDVDVAEEGKEL